jgi:hypothetical protein
MTETKAAGRITQFKMTPIASFDPSNAPIQGYFVDSTAPINVEDRPNFQVDPGSTSTTTPEQTYQTLQAIAQYLVASPDPQLIISIHGYGTKRSDAGDRYRRIYTYATDLCPPGTSVFLGYRWPSEKPSGDDSIKTGDPPVPDVLRVKLQHALEALPTLPFRVLTRGLLVIAIAAVLSIALSPLLDLLFRDLLALVIFLGIIPVSIILALILLRLSTYFRDNYRATNYGVPDLVELLRQLDLAVVEARQSKGQSANHARIKLSFIGHSMGCFVVTNTIRILSDVFDPAAINKERNPEIGNVFCLERLVLVAPDIPVETVIPRRANFLRSSLRRCKEAYIFASEGDLAVRLASTAANYFSFPGRTKFSGYRLGNLTVKRFKHELDTTNRQLQDQNYGIVNWQGDRVTAPYDWMEIRSSDREHKILNEIRDLADIEKENLDSTQDTPVSDLFTYFDCTDYVDIQDLSNGPTSVAQGVVTYALRKSALSLTDYLSLSLAYFLRKPRPINVHGGYFDGVFSQQLMYKLGFLGFSGLLTSFAAENLCPDWGTLDLDARKALLTSLSQQAQSKGIQIVLAPVRYQQDIQPHSKQT